MKKYTYAIFFLFFCILLSSCGMAKGKGEAQSVAESLFNDRIQSGWTGTDKYYSKIFWENTDAEKWTNIQNLVSRAMGELIDFSLQNWNIQSKVNINDISGTIVRLTYETEYEKGNGTETLTLHKPLLGERFTVLGHHINSEQIQELIEKGIQAVANDSEM